MTYFLLALFSIGLGMLAWKKFSLAVGIFIMLLPSYLIRFSFGPLPSTLLELSFGIIFLVWLLKYTRTDWPVLKQFFTKHRLFLISGILFFLASVGSIFVSDMWWYSLGQWRAYFFEPMLLFIVLVARQKTLPVKKYVLFLGLSTLSVSIFGIIQKYTGWWLPTEEWQNVAMRRITSWFTSPNAVGLYLGPVVPLLCIPLIQHWEKAAPRLQTKLMSLVQNPALWVLLSLLLALYFTKSLGSWVALFLGGLGFLFLLNYKKTAAVLLIVFFIVPLAFSPVRSFIMSKDRSSLNRVVLWHYSFEFLTASPKNFVFGTGLRQFFRKIQKPYYDVKELERLIYPHNIFLNFWTEIGLMGLVGFIGILVALGTTAYTVLKRYRLRGAALLSLLAIFVLHGLIDVPYFKNDLAMLFWIFAALIFSAEATA